MTHDTLFTNHAGLVARAKALALDLARERRGDDDRCRDCGAHLDWDDAVGLYHLIDVQPHHPATRGLVRHRVVQRLTDELINTVRLL